VEHGKGDDVRLRAMSLALAAIFVPPLSCKPPAPASPVLNPRRDGPIPPGRASIVVSKSARRLTLFVEGQEVFAARAALGRSAGGHKEREGDRRTPEGDYYVCTRNDRSRYRRFLGLSYPNLRDAEAGFKAGRITRAQRDAIAEAVRGRRRPPWDTPLGGEVGIHGSGSGRDWTLGCVAVDDPDIDVLWKACPLGTPVRIVP